MYVITINGQPATLKAIYRKEDKADHRLGEYERDSYLCSRTKQGAIKAYLHHIGFTWRERLDGIEVGRVGAIDIISNKAH